MNNPKVILADEPTGNLDSKTSVEILELLKELNEKYKTTFVVVTHSKVVYKYATRIIKMKDGLLVSNGRKFYYEEKGLVILVTALALSSVSLVGEKI